MEGDDGDGRNGSDAMMGGPLSRWTVSYFAAALGWLVGAEALMLGGFGFPAADLAAPDTLVVVHMVAVGWLSMALCGALFQFVPVLVNAPACDARLTLPALLLLNIGLAALLAGFLALGGRLPFGLQLLPAGGLLLASGFAVVVIGLGRTLWRARPLPAPARFVAVGLACGAAAALLGACFSVALVHPAGSIPAILLEAGVPLHAVAGLGGWLTLTAMGVSYRLLAMFMLAPDIDERRSGAAWLAGAASLAVALGGGLLTLFAAGDSTIALALAALLSLVAFALYGRDVVALYRSRRRRTLELNTRMAAWSLGALAICVVLGAALALTGRLGREAGAFAFLLAFGWLSGLVLAKLYKIVAFLTWLETYGPVLGATATPRVQDLVVEPRAARWFTLYFAAVWAGAGALFADAPTAFRIAALAMTVATLGLVLELARARRLDDVATPRRLPTGARAPHIFFSRSQRRTP